VQRFIDMFVGHQVDAEGSVRLVARSGSFNVDAHRLCTPSVFSQLHVWRVRDSHVSASIRPSMLKQLGRSVSALAPLRLADLGVAEGHEIHWSQLAYTIAF
jgi:hypothetical protein